MAFLSDQMMIRGQYYLKKLSSFEFIESVLRTILIIRDTLREGCQQRVTRLGFKTIFSNSFSWAVSKITSI